MPNINGIKHSEKKAMIIVTTISSTEKIVTLKQGMFSFLFVRILSIPHAWS